jgi:hypothetical protein
MKRLSDFKPLGLVELPDIGSVSGSGLTLIVGPNSAGKTRLLNDLNSRLCGDPRSTVVARCIELNMPEYQPLINCLVNEGYIRLPLDPAGRQQLVATTPYLGTGEIQPPVGMEQVRGWYDAYPTWEGASADRPNEFLQRIGRLLVTKLSLERRLTGLGTVGVINFETAPPQTELHSLRVNDTACSELAAETVRTFGKAVCSGLALARSVPTDLALIPRRLIAEWPVAYRNDCCRRPPDARRSAGCRLHRESCRYKRQ